MPLYEGRHDPGGSLGEVYDDPQPSTRVQVLAVEALPSGPRILLAMVRMGDHPEHELGLIDQVRATEREMQPRPRIEHDQPPVGIDCLGMRSSHTP